MKGAIFDVDGTVLDSMPMWLDVTVELLADFGVKKTREDCEQFMTMTLRESLPWIKNTYGVKMTLDEISELFKSKVINAYKNTIPAKPYVAEYIKKLHGGGVKIAVATSGYEGVWSLAFERLGILDCISAAAYSNEVGVNKSNPDIYLLAAQRLGVTPDECTVYEDILPGVEGAKKGGFSTCAVWDVSNDNDTDRLKSAADRYIHDFSELM